MDADYVDADASPYLSSNLRRISCCSRARSSLIAGAVIELAGGGDRDGFAISRLLPVGTRSGERERERLRTVYRSTFSASDRL